MRHDLGPAWLLLLALVLLWPSGAARGDEPPADAATETQYRTSAEVRQELARLAARGTEAGTPAEIVTYGTSAGGRPLLALRLGRAAPVVLVHGGLGRRDAAATVACLDLGERLLAEPPALERLSWLLLPAPNPDALDAFLAGRWPDGGGRTDRDLDGRRGEDGPSDVDGDGEILRMRRPMSRGRWAPAAAPPREDGQVMGDERLIEEKGTDVRRERSYEVYDEGLDDDGDGQVNEDPPGLDLRRQFVGWRDDKGPWRGDGPFPGFAPETRALMELSFGEAGLVAWYGFAGEGAFILRASEQGKVADADRKLYDRIVERLSGQTGLGVKKASAHLGPEKNPGSELDWACVHLGVPAFRIPVWRIEKEERSGRKRGVADELDWLLFGDRVLGGDAFVPWHAFDHPTLGPVEIGGWKRFTRFEPPPSLLREAVSAISAVPLAQVGVHARLETHAEVAPKGDDLYEVVVRVSNRGDGPTDTRVAQKHRLDVRIRVALEIADGVERVGGPPLGTLGRLEAGAVSSPLVWLLRRPAGPGRLAVIRVTHPRADSARLEVIAP